MEAKPAEHLTGVMGHAELVPIPDDLIRTPQQQSHLATWLLFAPHAHPVWSYYVMAACHLRPVPGETMPASKDAPDASHQLWLWAVNPDAAVYKGDDLLTCIRQGESWMLTPVNYTCQVCNLDDEQAKLLMLLLSRAVCAGLLNPETSGSPSAKDAWTIVISRTVEHMVHGGHPERPQAGNGLVDWVNLSKGGPSGT